MLSTLWIFFFFQNAHRRTLCTSWNSDFCSALPVPAVPVLTALADQEPLGLQCSTLHSFSSTPTHSTFFSLDCAPLCPIYCFTVPAVLPPKLQSLHFFPPLHFQLLPPLSFLSRNPRTDCFLERCSTFLSCQSCFKQPTFQGRKCLTVSETLR